jgi:hypothetical protein
VMVMRITAKPHLRKMSLPIFGSPSTAASFTYYVSQRIRKTMTRTRNSLPSMKPCKLFFAVWMFSKVNGWESEYFSLKKFWRPRVDPCPLSKKANHIINTRKLTKEDAITLHVSEATMVVIKATNNPVLKKVRTPSDTPNIFGSSPTLTARLVFEQSQTYTRSR